MSIPTFSVEGLISWLERQDPATEYDFCDCNGGCLSDLYGIERGLDRAALYALHTHFYKNGILWAVAAPQPNTYGAALARAKALT